MLLLANHSQTTTKPKSKHSNGTNTDWLRDAFNHNYSNPHPNSPVAKALKAGKGIAYQRSRFSVVGQDRSGKTTVIRRFRGLAFNPSEMSTCGGELQSVSPRHG